MRVEYSTSDCLSICHVIIQGKEAFMTLRTIWYRKVDYGVDYEVDYRCFVDLDGIIITLITYSDQEMRMVNWYCYKC